MTLQIGLVGPDGFVLASDKRCVSVGANIMTTSFTTEKIYFDHNWSAAWCASGHWCTDVICQALQVELERRGNAIPRGTQAVLLLLRRIVEAHAVEVSRANLGNGRILLIQDDQQGARGYWLDVGWVSADLAWGVTAGREFLDKMHGGDLGNSAVLFADAYYNPTCTVDRLARLAAHVILMGAKLNPSWVEGLEIVIGERGDLRRCAPSEIEQFVEFSKTLDFLISRQLRGSLV